MLHPLSLISIFILLALSGRAFASLDVLAMDGNATSASFRTANPFLASPPNTDRFRATVVSASIDPPCVVRVPSASALQLAPDAHVLVLVDWAAATADGACTTIHALEDALNATATASWPAQKWLMLVYAARANFDDIAGPYNAIPSADMLALEPDGGHALATLLKSQISVAASVQREPGYWNDMYTSTGFAAFHWICFTVNAVAFCICAVFLYKALKSRNSYRPSNHIVTFTPIKDFPLIFYSASLLLLLGSMFGLQEQLFPVSRLIVTLVLWLIFILALLLVMAEWAHIANVIHPRREYRWLRAHGALVGFITTAAVAFQIVALVARVNFAAYSAANDILLKLVPAVLLANGAFYVLSSIHFLLWLRAIGSKALVADITIRRLEQVTYLCLFSMLSVALLTASYIITLFPIAAYAGYMYVLIILNYASVWTVFAATAFLYPSDEIVNETVAKASMAIARYTQTEETRAGGVDASWRVESSVAELTMADDTARRSMSRDDLGGRNTWNASTV